MIDFFVGFCVGALCMLVIRGIVDIIYIRNENYKEYIKRRIDRLSK